MDACVHKIEQQLRRYKEKVQNHKGDVTHAGPFPRSSRASAVPKRLKPIPTRSNPSSGLESITSRELRSDCTVAQVTPPRS